MRFFNKPHIHSHSYDHKEIYKLAFNEIIINHNMEYKFIAKCKCGDTITRTVGLGFNLI